MITLPVSYSIVGAVYSGFPSISSVSALTSAVVHAYMGKVEAEINAKISKRYALPIVGECPILSAISERETIYRIAVQRQLVNFPPAQQGRHPLQTQHIDDQKLLEDIALGKVQLFTVTSAGVFSSVVPADTSQIEVYSTTMNQNPTFHEGGWYDQVQDTEKLDDIIDDRVGRGL